MPYIHDISLCEAAEIGDGGVTQPELAAMLERTRPVFDELRNPRRPDIRVLLDLPGRRDDLARCRSAAEDFLRGAEDVVVLGTGGSSLGAQALSRLNQWHRLPPAMRELPHPRVHFMDNLDAHAMSGLLETFDLKTVRFLVVSKSGGTPETLIQMLAILDALKRSGLDWNAEHHMLAISQPAVDGENPLRAICAAHHIPVLDHDPDVGGRFSVLSNVGMLPAIMMGLDAEAIRSGAAEVLATLSAAVEPAGSPPFVGAALQQVLCEKRGLSVAVMMPYADRLRLFSNWFVQLWAESLGKSGKGTTPIAAAGPVDQHSQLQLFLDGPDDKFFTLVTIDHAGSGPRIDEGYRNDPALGYLAGRTIGDLVDCQQRATARALADRGRPVRTLGMARLDERTLGALFMHFILETIVAGHLLGVDPFGQPAVEEGKRLTREYLARM